MHHLSFLRRAFWVSALLGLASASAQAKDFKVTNTSDDAGACSISNCSLRAAIQAANARPGDDAVFFASGVSGPIMQIHGPFAVTGNLKINGPSQRTVSISAQDSRVFTINAGKVFLSHLEIRDGKSSEGAGIYNSVSGELTVVDCVFGGNGSPTSSNPIYQNGGAIYNAGVAIIRDSSFFGNGASGPPSNDGGIHGGGAIYNAAGRQMTITNTVFQANNALQGNGGAIYNAGNLSLSKSSLGFNSATLAVDELGVRTGNGGAVANTGVLAVKDCIFNSNRGIKGGGLQNTGALSLQSTTFTLNRATVYDPQNPNAQSMIPTQGGGVYNDSGNKSAAMVNCTFDNNSSEGRSPSSYFDDSAKSGGGLYNNSGKISLVNCTFAENRDNSGNTAASARVGTLVNLGTLTAQNTVFVDGNAQPFYGFTNPTGSGDARKNFFFQQLSSDFAPSAGLSFLANYGGPVPTMALKPGSPLIDAGLTNGAPSTDARGQVRPLGNGVDVGAFEGEDPSFAFTALTISPAQPKTGDILKAYATTRNATYKASYTYVWKRNDVVVKTTTNSKSSQDRLDLSIAGNGDKNDRITVEVTAVSGQGNGYTGRIKGVRVVNTPPVLNEVTLSRLSPTPTQIVSSKLRGGDADKTDTVTPIYKWMLGDTVLPDETGSTLDLSKYTPAPGTVLTLEVVLSDGTDLSQTLKVSANVTSGSGANLQINPSGESAVSPSAASS